MERQPPYDYPGYGGCLSKEHTTPADGGDDSRCRRALEDGNLAATEDDTTDSDPGATTDSEKKALEVGPLPCWKIAQRGRRYALRFVEMFRFDCTLEFKKVKRGKPAIQKEVIPF